MCLAIPGKIIELNGEGLQRMGRLRFGPITKDVNICLVPDAQVGDYVLVHAGFAIHQIDKGEALKTLDLMENCEIKNEIS